VSATYASVTKRQVEDQAVLTLGYPGGVIGVVETGFVSNNPFTIEMHGTRASLAYDSTDNQLRIRSARADTWEPQSVPPDEADPFSRWVTHIREGTRAADNLARAVELTRLVSAANTAAATGTTVPYGIACSVSAIKVGVLGGGGILEAHIRGYRAYADAIKVTAVADVVEETARRRAVELDAAAYTDFREMIFEADIDAVDMCLPHHLHAEAIVAAAQAGKHILCEKRSA
jgi:predicted dehydrogenase